MPHYDYPMAATTTTMVLYDKSTNKILLGKRDSNKSSDAYPGYWCLPGGFLNVGQERTINTARRETLEEVGLDIDESRWHLFYIDDRPGADPRYAQVINVCYYACVTSSEVNKIQADDDIEAVNWVHMDDALKLKLTFDHNRILEQFFLSLYVALA